MQSRKLFSCVEQHLRQQKHCAAIVARDCGDCDSEPAAPAAPSQVQLMLEHNEGALNVAEGLAELRYNRNLNGPEVEAAKQLARVANKRSREQAFGQLQHLLQPGVRAADVEAALAAADPFEGVETRKKETALLKQHYPMLETRITNLGDGHRVVGVNVLDAIIRLLRENPEVRRQMFTKSDEWKRGEFWRKSSTRLDHLDQGSACRNHPHLMRPATPDEAHDIRIAIILYADEVEVCAAALCGTTPTRPPNCPPHCCSPHPTPHRTPDAERTECMLAMPAPSPCACLSVRDLNVV